MRRKDREITDRTEMLEILARCDTIRLAMHDEPYPYVVPLSFGFEAEGDALRIYCHCAKEGKKIDLLQKNPCVSFECDCGQRLYYDEEKQSCTTEYASLIGQGTVRFTGSEEEKLHGLRVLMRHYYPDEEKPFSLSSARETAVFIIDAVSLTGKRRRIRK